MRQRRFEKRGRADFSTAVFACVLQMLQYVQDLNHWLRRLAKACEQPRIQYRLMLLLAGLLTLLISWSMFFSAGLRPILALGAGPA